MNEKQKHLSVMILSYNEEINLPDCLASLQGLDAELILVDSYSTDRTLEIAKKAGCDIYQHPFEHYGAQRNWAFDNIAFNTPWVLCLDSDERLTAELVEEINQIVSQPQACNGFLMCKRSVFMGRWIKHGGQYPSYHLRLTKVGKGRCEDREYDQHYICEGKVGRLKNDYIDVIGTDIIDWTSRHTRWVDMEAKELLAELKRQAPAKQQVQAKLLGNPVQRKRFMRSKLFGKTPRFLRAFLFWFYIYIVRLGFLDGKPGLIFHTLRCFWFRFLVDARLYEIEQRTPEKQHD